MALSAVRVAAKSSTSSASVIFLHGLGDSGEGWSFLAEEANKRPKLDHVNFIFPNAPNQPVTLNFGMQMPSWHDIKDLNKLEIDDEAGVYKSMRIVESFIKEQIDKGIPSNRIVLGGFSQGGAMSLATSIVTDHKLAGVMSLSGYMPCHKLMESTKKPINEDTHTIMCHGTDDQVVQFKYGQLTRDFMKNSVGRQFLEWHEYPGLPHSASPEEINHVLNFLERVIPSE